MWRVEKRVFYCTFLTRILFLSVIVCASAQRASRRGVWCLLRHRVNISESITAFLSIASVGLSLISIYRMLKLIEWEPQVKAEMEEEILYCNNIRGERKDFSCFNSEIKKKQKQLHIDWREASRMMMMRVFHAATVTFFLFSIYTVVSYNIVGIRVED